jgi:hypothetical protein
LKRKRGATLTTNSKNTCSSAAERLCLKYEVARNWARGKNATNDKHSLSFAFWLSYVKAERKQVLIYPGDDRMSNDAE